MPLNRDFHNSFVITQYFTHLHTSERMRMSTRICPRAPHIHTHVTHISKLCSRHMHMSTRTHTQMHIHTHPQLKTLRKTQAHAHAHTRTQTQNQCTCTCAFILHTQTSTPHTAHAQHAHDTAKHAPRKCAQLAHDTTEHAHRKCAQCTTCTRHSQARTRAPRTMLHTMCTHHLSSERDDQCKLLRIRS